MQIYVRKEKKKKKKNVPLWSEKIARNDFAELRIRSKSEKCDEINIHLANITLEFR